MSIMDFFQENKKNIVMIALAVNAVAVFNSDIEWFGEYTKFIIPGVACLALFLIYTPSTVESDPVTSSPSYVSSPPSSQESVQRFEEHQVNKSDAFKNFVSKTESVEKKGGMNE